MAVAWPAGVPQRFEIVADYSGPSNTFITTQFDRGTNSRRRNSLASEEPVTLNLVAITVAQYLELKEWFKIALSGGSLEFEMPDPLDGYLKTWVFLDPARPMAASPVGSGRVDVNLMLAVVPS